jgi:hypothetical protein
VTNDFAFHPVIIVGAGRSGTNLLRDLLCQVDGIGTWPCDEINYTWRHGNMRHPNDELPATAARPEVRDYIRRQFIRMAEMTGSEILVEKTCANSLRIDFVDAVIPEAKYIFIVRNGVDVAASALRRWHAHLDIAYLARKARFVPWRDLPYYANRYLGNRLYRVWSRENRLAFWGPKFSGFDTCLASSPLDEVCARQWQACVRGADGPLATLGEKRVQRLRYEDLVTRPSQTLATILEFLGMMQTLPGELDFSHVSSNSIGRGAEQLGQHRAEYLAKMLCETLGRFGYA